MENYSVIRVDKFLCLGIILRAIETNVDSLISVVVRPIFARIFATFQREAQYLS